MEDSHNSGDSFRLERTVVSNIGRGSVHGDHGGFQKGRDSDKPICYHCGGEGHVIAKCWVLHGKPSSEGANTMMNNQMKDDDKYIMISREEYNRLIKSQFTSRPANASSSIIATYSQTGMSLACRSSVSQTWVIDSGASEHMTGDSSIFTSLYPSKSLSTVTLADGSKSNVAGVGIVSPSPSLTLSSVLHVPRFPLSLLSVSQLAKRLNCDITFSPSSCVFRDRKTNQVIGSGTESGGLYYLDAPLCSSTTTLSHGLASSTSVSLFQLHCQLGHPSLPSLKHMYPQFGKVSVLECESCELGKHKRVSYNPRVDKRVSEPFELIHSDIWGPCPTTSLRGFKYFVTFIDDFSRCTWVFLMRSRSDLFATFSIFCAEIKNQFGKTIKILRSDNAPEYKTSLQMQHFLSSNGIILQTSCAHTPAQNGVAERKNRHLLEVSRAMMFQMNVPKLFWEDAVLTACYLINRMPSIVLGKDTPINVLSPGKKCFHITPKIFGSTCFVHKLGQGSGKLDPKSIKCVFLGYSRGQKGYKCYCPSLKRTFVCKDVTFFESTPYFSSSQSKTVLNDHIYFDAPNSKRCDSPDVPIVFPPNITPSIPIGNDPSDNCLVPPPSVVVEETTISRSTDISQRRPPPIIHTYERRPKEILDARSTCSPQDSVSPPTVDMLDGLDPSLDLPIAQRKGKRSCTQYPIANYISYESLSPSFRSFLTKISSHSIPKNLKEALLSSEWKAAMVEEMHALEQNETWDLVPLPRGKSVVGCRWVYAVKTNPDGSVARYKARLVAKGYSQTYGVDYVETFSPVAKMTSIRLIISLATISDWPLFQLDVSNAFLHGDLDEEVYMEQPPGFVAQGECGHVCKLRKSLYGLKQSSRAWFGRFSTALGNFGMMRCAVDHSVFYRHTTVGCILLVVYVDDIVITGSDTKGIDDLKRFLNDQFQTKDLGKLKYFLGIEVARCSKGICLMQRKYTLDLLRDAGMMNCKPVENPMDPNTKLLKDEKGGPLYMDAARYRRLVGKLNYLTITRPDIAFSVSVVSQFMTTPRVSHMDAVIRILRYLKGTPGVGLVYKKNGHMKVEGYSDADYDGSPFDRRSTTGYCVFVGGNMISWKSKKQHTVSRSSAESEYRAMAQTTCELVWVKQLLKELGQDVNGPMHLLCDNKAAMYIASNPVFHERTKHIEVDCHFVREKLMDGTISTKFVRTDDQLADIFTKSLTGSRIRFIRCKLGNSDILSPTLLQLEGECENSDSHNNNYV